MNKIKVSEEKFDINLTFYFFLKHLIKTKLTENQAKLILSTCSNKANKDWESIVNNLFSSAESFKGKKREEFFSVIERITSLTTLKLFTFSLRLFCIKDLLLAEAKLKNISISDKLNDLPPLSLEYDKLSLLNPYSTRVNGALLALIFFEKIEKVETNFISRDTESFLKNLSIEAIDLKKLGVEPNQIFMLVFNESINQSIISDSGINYEDRIYSVLVSESVGLLPRDIQKTHDDNDKSTEFDFLFNLQGRSYGLGAKKTLRERYKQFIKTGLTSNIDVMIEITIGLDLNQGKAETIRSHGTYIFLADEIYETRPDLQVIEGVFPTSQLTKNTLLSLK